MSTIETEVNEKLEEVITSNEEVIISKEVDTFPEINNWEDLNIREELLRGIYSYGFETPSPIQKKAIPHLINKRDIVVQAQSGTGKTATFTIGALANIDLNDSSTQVLVLSPTKELTIQTAKVFDSIGNIMRGLRVKSMYGGMSIDEGSSFSSRNVPHVICGCPGRVFDMMRRDKLSTRKIKFVVIDEADEMLSAGFKDQIYNIFQYLNEDVQVALVSATLPDSVEPIIDKIMRNPVRISVKREMLTLEGIKQFFIAVDDDREKYMTLKDIFKYINLSHCIIYCNSVKRVQDLYEAMKEDEFPVCRLHSGMEKNEREISFNSFKKGVQRILISSNVTARGIDIQQVSVVVNFDLPKDVNTYLHRIGRSGRWGRKGIGINLVTRRDYFKLKEIETHYATQIKEMPANVESIFH
jgi:superfamily II DNA/RNA helicase